MGRGRYSRWDERSVVCECIAYARQRALTLNERHSGIRRMMAGVRE